MDVQRSAPKGAVFLSYAHEDAAAARRIAEALRSAGLEVWFDENDLRGGDQWDQKIRTQIKACALFVTVISTATQTREEAYFRLEWKLADDRTHLMAPGKAFIVPVVIDETPEAGASVPDSFARAQWTRLPGGLPTPDFVAQMKRLLEPAKKPALKVGPPRPPTLPPEFRQAARVAGVGDPGPASTRPATSRGLPGWTWGALTAVVVGVAVAVFLWLRHPAAETRPIQRLEAAATSAPVRPAAADKSIAVLPFANMSADKENEFFADGMHDDLITALAKVRDLKVISRTSTLAYRDTAARNLKKIATELGVATVLEGSVQRAGNRVRINVQLIDARTDAHLWAETYNRELTDLFALQSELVQQVTGALKATLTAGEQDLLARRPTQNQKAYDLYLRARVLDESIGPGALKEPYERAIAVYEQAAAQDPGFALPHVQASILHGTLYWFRYHDPTPERRARAAAELDQARRLAPEAPETRLAEGSFEYTCNNDWRKSLEYYHLAEAGLPNNAQLLYRIGLAHRRLGQLSEALDRVRRGVALNPNDASGTSTYLEILLALRRYPEVIEQAGPIEARFPGDSRLQLHRLRAQFDLDGDRDAYLHRIQALPANATDAGVWSKELRRVMDERDYAAADRMLADRKETIMPDDANEPVTLVRARIAWLQGHGDDARRFALAALDVSRGDKAPPRYQPSVQLDIAEALALAGRVDEAVSIAEAARTASRAMDGYTYVILDLSTFGRIMVICGRREDAFRVLRDWVAGPGAHANQIRFDPVWSRMKDDQRFEEILRSAKAL